MGLEDQYTSKELLEAYDRRVKIEEDEKILKGKSLFAETLDLLKNNTYFILNLGQIGSDSEFNHIVLFELGRNPSIDQRFDILEVPVKTSIRLNSRLKRRDGLFLKKDTVVNLSVESDIRPISKQDFTDIILVNSFIKDLVYREFDKLKNLYLT